MSNRTKQRRSGGLTLLLYQRTLHPELFKILAAGARSTVPIATRSGDLDPSFSITESHEEGGLGLFEEALSTRRSRFRRRNSEQAPWEIDV